MKVTVIRVPATSANLGPGFDSIGIALNLYLTLEIKEARQDWLMTQPFSADIPSDKRNLIIKTALALVPDLPPHHLVETTNIPLARGLGSSSSAIVAGIELANQLGGLGLSNEEKLQIAVRLEGHPDNVAPVIYGNFVVATFDGVQANAISAPFPAAKALVFVPGTKLLTAKSRAVLPKQLSLRNAVATSSAANVLVAAVLRGNLQLATQMMGRDQFHETYRRQLVPQLGKIRQVLQNEGIYGTYLSGAGPTVLTMVAPDSLVTAQKAVKQLALAGEWLTLDVDTSGLMVTK
ncbi:homoserine kinase [Loigolactobacillus backii]|uniref:homoserine kinase n=1 Tax=Loigolactobacillus backii TaxID=375175 RepID=UPI0007F17324|nr:homoserine kinase [Loigolactobacillus backii]ANK59033.1 homoserine kinase [Loigolactobacillus backii]ANK64021.1 homoserine kinase [Loigolactobacillus backii]ANK66470.1 homoserine kinase [Loigolactobacillus backii]OLF69856.1 serine kinase [Loigolactobacillus backii]